MNNKGNGHFTIGFLTGAAVFTILSAGFYFIGPKQTYDHALNDMGARAIANATQVESCTRAFLNSHNGKLPKGTLVEGVGAGIVVVGYEASMPQ